MSLENWAHWREPYIPATEAGDNHVYAGDSQVNYDQWQPSLRARLRGTPTYHNVGVPGQTLANLVALDASTVDPLFNPSAAGNYLFVWALTNDYAGGAAPSEAMASVAAYCAARRAVHPWTGIFVATTLPRGNAPDPTAYEANRLAGNVLLRANYLSYGADALIDPATDPRLGATGANTNPTYFMTEVGNPWVHINATGGDIFARLAYDQYRALKLRLFA